MKLFCLVNIKAFLRLGVILTIKDLLCYVQSRSSVSITHVPFLLPWLSSHHFLLFHLLLSFFTSVLPLMSCSHFLSRLQQQERRTVTLHQGHQYSLCLSFSAIKSLVIQDLMAGASCLSFLWAGTVQWKYNSSHTYNLKFSSSYIWKIKKKQVDQSFNFPER